MNTKTLQTIDWHNVPEHEINLFLSYTKDLQYHAIHMVDTCQDPFERELYETIILLTARAEKDALKRDMGRAWRAIKQIINKGIVLDNDIKTVN